jgi:transcriptional regulator GlxA family with amidase domain
VALFPGFQALDAFGPLDCINVLSRTDRHRVSLSILSSTMEPVTTKPPGFPDAIGQSIVPTHTFATAPPLDVLLVPGGRGTRGSSSVVLETVAFIQRTYPQLKYLITVCTGSGLAARAGVLDGKRATTNKIAWQEITALRPEVIWVPRARWVTDGNIWTSSGVSAGIDVTLAWIEEVFGTQTAKKIADGIEYTRHDDPGLDPFADLYGL